MKKNVLSFVIVLCSHLVFAQVGIGTPSPRGALDINKPTTNDMGLVLPTNANVNNMINPLGGGIIPGTIMYDSTNDCVRLFKGTNVWSNCLIEGPNGGGSTGTVATLNCSGATSNGNLTSGTPASGVSSSVPYTGGNGGSYAAQSIPSTGVTGLTATLNAGNFANGSGSLTYTITGTPSSAGTASFSINIGGQSCTFTRAVDAGAGTIVTLNCSGATNNGNLNSGTPASGVSSVISYTGGDGGSYAAQSIPSTGVTGLTATLNAGNFANGNGSLTYTITGTPSSAGTASFAINIGGQSCTFTRTVDAGAGTITTLNCSGATNNGTLTSGSSASGVSSVISYTGGNGGSYNAQSITSTGVTGLTATLNAGNFANGSGSLTYTITGTPSSAGTASFAINIGGQSCTFTRTVDAGAGTITTLNCSGATNNGTLTSGSSASGVSSVISYTGGNGGSYNAQSITSTGVTGLTATLNAGNFANGNGSLTYTITGTPTSSGAASFAINIGGQACTLTRNVNSDTPPNSSLSPACSGLRLNSINGEPINGTVNGLPVTATFTTSVSSPKFSANPGIASKYCGNMINDYTVSGGDHTFGPTPSLTFKFNRDVSNIVVLQGNGSGHTAIRYTLKRNGVVVSPTITNIACFLDGSIGNFNISGNTVTVNSSGSVEGGYNIGGVWFDEIIIERASQDSGSITGQRTLFKFCVNSAQ